MVATTRRGRVPSGEKQKAKTPPAISKDRARRSSKVLGKDSDTCLRSQDLTDTQKRDMRDKLYELVGRTKQDSTICPSQVPRALNKVNAKAYPDWRGLMDPVREVVWEEVRHGRLQVTQGGEERKYEQRNSLKGPIRVKRGPNWGEAKT